MDDEIINQKIEFGKCHCGCGGYTTIPKNNHSKFSYIKGMPVRFISGHQARGKNNPKWNGGRRAHSAGYVFLWAPNHPRSNKNYILEHIVIAEKVLGRIFDRKIEVHHVNEIKNDNRNENLVICEDCSYHNLLHMRMKALRICGHASWRRCVFCKQYDSQDNIFVDQRNRPYHKKCELQYQKIARDRKREAKRSNPEPRFIGEATNAAT